MALDRQTIEKKDFPVGRRGYEPEAVDAHLGAIAEEVEQLARQVNRPTESLASVASTQIRTIVEAAEATAHQIRAEAEQEAQRIRADASREAHRLRAEAGRDAKAVRDQANAEASEYIARMSTSGSEILARIEGMEREITSVIENLRGGAARLVDDLALLDSDMGVALPTPPVQRSEPQPEAAPEPQPEAAPEPQPEPAPEPPREPAPAFEPAAAVDEQPLPDAEAVLGEDGAPMPRGSVPPPSERRDHEPGQAPVMPVAEPLADAPPPAFEPPLAPVHELHPQSSPFEAELVASAGGALAEENGLRFERVAPQRPAATAGGHNPDAEGARLIALNMALNGSSREEVERYLVENFELADRRALLDEVYSSVDG